MTIRHAKDTRKDCALVLRPADISDCELLFNWKNEPVTRQSAFNTSIISKEKHEKWFTDALNNHDIKIYILESDGKPVGQTRINRKGETGIIDYSIDVYSRGRGLGKKLISLLEEEIKRTGFTTILKAEVKKENTPSCHVFDSLGYSECEEETFFSYTKYLRPLVIISNKEWHRKHVEEVAKRTGIEVVYLSKKGDVSFENLKRYNPQYVFFPHWSYIIPAEVYENFECIVFHMTDLPFGRGGSPLQNLIERGIYETKISALRVCKELDAGDIYLKRPLSLWGAAEEIYLRAGELTKEMMIEIVKNRIHPVPQTGDSVTFKRRKPEQGCIQNLESLEKVFDYIRMLDADGYPRAFLDSGRFHLEFERASMKNGFIHSDVKISIKEEVGES